MGKSVVRKTMKSTKEKVYFDIAKKEQPKMMSRPPTPMTPLKRDSSGKFLSMKAAKERADKFRKAKKEYLKHMMSSFRGKEHSKKIACEIMAFSVPPEEVAAYMNQRLGMTDYPTHPHAEVLGRFKIAQDLHEMYFDQDAAAIRRGQYKIGAPTPTHQDALMAVLAKRRASIDPDEVEEKAREIEFVNDLKTMETLTPAQMDVRIAPPTAPPAPKLNKKDAVVHAEIKQLEKNTDAAVNKIEDVAVQTTATSFDKAITQVFADKPIKQLTPEEVEIKQALLATSSGILKESLLKLAEQMTLKQMQDEKLRAVAQENAKLKETLAEIERAKSTEVKQLDKEVDHKENVVDQLASSPAVSQATVEKKNEELERDKAELETKQRELDALRQKVADATPVLHYKTVTPLEMSAGVTSGTPVAVNSLNLTKVVSKPESTVPAEVAQTAAASRTEQVKSTYNSTSALVKKHGSSAGKLFSRILGSTTDSLERIIPVVTNSANTALPKVVDSIGPLANTFSQNAVPVTTAGITVAGDISKYRQQKQMDKIKLDKYKAKHGIPTSAQKKAAAAKSKPKKSSSHKKPRLGKREQFTTDYIGAEFGSSSEDGSDDEMPIGSHLSAGDETSSDAEDDDYERALIGTEFTFPPALSDDAQKPRLELRKLVGAHVEDMEQRVTFPLHPDVANLVSEVEPIVRVDARGMVLIDWVYTLLPEDTTEFQFPAHLSVRSVLGLLSNHNVKIVILQRFYLFCLYYPRVHNERSKDIVALRERIYGVLNVPSEIIHPEVPDDIGGQITRESVDWIHEMKGRNLSEFGSFKEIHDFWLYLILSMIRSDDHCRNMFYFIFDYSPSMCYEDASKITFSERSAQNIHNVMSQFH
jgi:hypothetical protein